MLNNEDFFNRSEIISLIRHALNEDIGDGDHSSTSSIPAGTLGKARMLIKEEGVLAGVELARIIFREVDPKLQVEINISDGQKVKVGDIALIVTGSVHSILKSERLVLNLAQRLSGVATMAAKLSQMVEGTNCRILDTRKTTPGLRLLEKWAVKIGGAHNHRFGLFDMIMLKDNHVDYAGGITQAVKRTREYLKQNNLDLKIEVETRTLEEVQEALYAEVDRIMLDNFSPALLKEAVKLISGKCETEASGGITIDTVREYAMTGVDFISVGALTHSVKSMDISLKQF